MVSKAEVLVLALYLLAIPGMVFNVWSNYGVFCSIAAFIIFLLLPGTIFTIIPFVFKKLSTHYKNIKTH